MKTLTIKLDDPFAKEIEHFQQIANYSTKSKMIRDALRTLMVTHRKAKLEANLKDYLQDKQALQEAADAVEVRMPSTIEALNKITTQPQIYEDLH